MADASAAGITAPPHGVDLGPPPKSTPLAVGSAIVSQHISTVGLNVSDICLWTRCDGEIYRECPVDEMLQELFYRCVDRSKPLPDKSTLLADCLKAILPICKNGRDLQTIKQHLGDLIMSMVEEHKPFVQASNLVLDRLSKLDALGLAFLKARNDDKIVFHQNDSKNVTKRYQGEKSVRNLVVVVSRACTKKVRKQSGQAHRDEEALENPTRQFQWADVQLMVEFKHKKTRTGLLTPLVSYAANAYNVPEARKYIKYRRETNHTVEPTGSTSLPGHGPATSSHLTLYARGRSTPQAQNDKKRGSSQALGGYSSKKVKVDDEKEPQRIAKLYWPEGESESEPAVLQKVYRVAENEKEGKVKYHVPEMVWSHRFEDTSPPNIRKTLELEDAEHGRHVLYIIIFRKLEPITNLSDKQFLAAWWHIVVCHFVLWGHNIHHGDISPGNFMVYKTSDDRYIGVLNDFDLSTTGDSSSGQERTGTVPFMAIELLSQRGTEGKVKHLYRHDAESFIWVLTWVCFRYQEGQLLRRGGPLDDWTKVDAKTCREKKNDFVCTGRHKAKPSSSHQSSWKIARSSLRCVGRFYLDDPEASDSDAEVCSHPQTDAAVFEHWLKQRIHKMLPPELLDVHVKSISL